MDPNVVVMSSVGQSCACVSVGRQQSDGLICKNHPLGNIRFIRKCHATPSPDINMQKNVAKRFAICRAVPGVLAAGGSVMLSVEDSVMAMCDWWEERSSMSTKIGSAERDWISTRQYRDMSGDLDLYICAEDQREAVRKLSALITVLRPVGMCSITKYAISMFVKSEHFTESVCIPANHVDYPFQTQNGSIKVQVINGFIQSGSDTLGCCAELFSTFDLSCCKFATDGENLYASHDAITTMFDTRINRLSRDKLSGSTPWRLAKYFRRMYDFVVEDVPPEVGMTEGLAAVLAICTNSYVDPSGATSWYDWENIANGNPLTYAFGNFIKRSSLKMICGDASRIHDMIESGRQPREELSDWCFKHLSKECERIMKTVYLDEDKELARGIVCKTVDSFMAFMEAVDMRDSLMMSSLTRLLPHESAEDIERIWYKPIKV